MKTVDTAANAMQASSAASSGMVRVSMLNNYTATDYIALICDSAIDYSC